MNFKYTLIVLTFFLSVASLPSHAGKIYRFLDENGVSTLSKVLPPYVAQQGYDILDDKTYRLIEHVMTLEESSKINAEQARIAKIKEAEEKRRVERLVNDRSLLDRYPDDRVMIKARDNDLAFVKKQIADVTEHKEINEKKLRMLQQNAANAELAGQAVSASLDESLNAARSEIANDTIQIERLKVEHAQTSAQYDADLARLRELLHLPASVEETVTTEDKITEIDLDKAILN